MRRGIRAAALIICLALLLALFTACGGEVGGEKVCPEGETAEESVARRGLKGVWVSTVYQLDYPQTATRDPALLQTQADEILETCAEMGMDAVFLQVRPSCDALYPSQLFPWSRYLTGAAGEGPEGDFDPLGYWVERAHALDLELHAWINPFRVTRDGEKELAALAESSPAARHPEWVVEHEGNYYLDPGVPEVRELAIRGAEELVRGYELDGIHLDDYFYPGPDFDDGETYETYGAGFEELGDWRRANINALVKALDQRLHAMDPALSFGISPSGVWADRRSLPQGSDTTGGYESYFTAFADSRKWVKEGWVDYICPQIYWYIGHPTMDYETVARWWKETVEGTGVKLYIGMADYKADAGEKDDPWYGLGALEAQLALNETLGADGAVHFRYRFLANNEKLKKLYKDWHALKEAGVSAPAMDFLSRLPQAELGHWGARYYGELGALGIVTGRPDGTYAPEEGVERSSMAAVVCRTLAVAGRPLSGGGTECPFEDVRGTWAEGEISELWKAGFLEAEDYPEGFKHTQPMSRLEVVKLLMRSLGERDDGSVTQSRFPDVEQGAYYVERAAALGVVTGKEDGTFGPDEEVTRAAAAALLWRALPYFSRSGG